MAKTSVPFETNRIELYAKAHWSTDENGKPEEAFAFYQVGHGQSISKLTVLRMEPGMLEFDATWDIEPTPSTIRHIYSGPYQVMQ